MLPRIRTIKPEFFQHEELYDLEKETGFPIRLSFAGLWVCSDREGRFRWRPRTLKSSILPHDEVDFSRVLDAMATRGFVVKYASKGEYFGYIPSWHKHQFINNKEKPSDLPPPEGEGGLPPLNQPLNASSTREARDEHATGTRGVREGKGREGKGTGTGTIEQQQLRIDETDPLLSFNGVHFSVTDRQDSILRDAFPWVDRQFEYKRADSWLEANPDRRPKNYTRFLHNWFTKVPNPASGVNANGSKPEPTRFERNLEAAGLTHPKVGGGAG